MQYDIPQVGRCVCQFFDWKPDHSKQHRMALRRAELRQETSSFDECAETDLSLNSDVNRRAGARSATDWSSSLFTSGQKQCRSLGIVAALRAASPRVPFLNVGIQAEWTLPAQPLDSGGHRRKPHVRTDQGFLAPHPSALLSEWPIKCLFAYDARAGRSTSAFETKSL
jgi:hypothetical protein